MGRSIGVLFALAFALFFTWGTAFAEVVIRASDRAEIGFSRMVKEVREGRVIMVGEEHDSMLDHLRQIKILKALNDSGLPLAIGLEMFTSRDQKVLEKWVAGSIEETDFVGHFLNNWSVPWAYYRDIFLFARRHGIPMIGLNLPREITRKVAAEGFAALTGEQRKDIPGSVTCEVDAAYMALIRRSFADHGMSERSFVHFCEAQMLWNRSMAWNILDYLRREPARTLVVIAGKAHAMKPAVPREILKERSVDIRVILPEDILFTPHSVSVEDTDYLITR